MSIFSWFFKNKEKDKKLLLNRVFRHGTIIEYRKENIDGIGEVDLYTIDFYGEKINLRVTLDTHWKVGDVLTISFFKD